MFSLQTITTGLLAVLPLAAAYPQGIIKAREAPCNATVTKPEALKWYEAGESAGLAKLDTTAHCYGGQIDAEPSVEEWAQFDLLWEKFVPTFPNTDEQNEWLKQAINEVSAEAKVDRRVILAMVFQESRGDIDVPCTAGSNCGLLQGPTGSTGLDPSNPKKSIRDQIGQGIHGTLPDNGLVGYLNMPSSLSWTNNPAPGNLYTALRCYNSGKIVSDNLDTVEYGTASYVNDIANRLHGWDGNDSLVDCQANGKKKLL
jgi:hypothetical protein